MKLKIEQIAIYPADRNAALELLSAMGAEFLFDIVEATGHACGVDTKNQAALAFDYRLITDGELEVINYTDGVNWLQNVDANCVSHFGMHCTEDELKDWREFFTGRGIHVAQEVWTTNHANPQLCRSRRYHYVIFRTRQILGVDLKFIVRHEHSEENN